MDDKKHNERKQGARDERRLPYTPPAIEEEAEFESLAGGCDFDSTGCRTVSTSR